MELRKFLALALVVLSTGVFAQEQPAEKQRKFKISKGYISWGYNRSNYTKSDVRVWGDGFDFTIHDAVGKDDPSKFSSDVYLNPLKFTIPQFDFRLGVLVNDAFYLSFGWDHMKYVFQNRPYAVSGSIDKSKSARFGGTYDGAVVDVPNAFYYHENTDGLNYIHLSVDKPMDVFQTKNNLVNFKLNFEVGTGPVCPWTDADMFGTHYRTPSIHFAGWGLNLGVKPRLFFFNEHLYAQFTLRGGYINLWNMWLYNDGVKGQASQNFFYTERAFVLGYMINF